jgi:hypothetical protein
MSIDESKIKQIKMVKSAKILGLDVSTKTIGFALFEIGTSKLLDLTHISPKIKPQPEDKIEELINKADIFKKFLEPYKDLGIVSVVIEEPLLNSNNVFTVGTLLRFNSMILKICYDVLGVVPKFITTYEARKNAFPDLMSPNEKGRIVLFGKYPKDIDKKKVVWEHVNILFPEIKWQYGKTGALKKECFDESDAVTCVIGYVNKLKNEEKK